MWRFLAGILFVQAATVALVLVTITASPSVQWPAVGLIVLITSVLAALWFGSIARHLRKDEVVRAKESFAQEREQIRVRAEKAKAKVVEQSHKQAVKEATRAHAKANFKVGAAVIGAVGAGVVFLVAEFLTLGLLTLSTIGGGLAGYAVRARQEVVGNRKDQKRVTAKNKPPLLRLLSSNNTKDNTSRLEKKSV